MSETAPSFDVEHDPVHRAAAAWLTKLQDAELAVEDLLEWQQWVNADPRHREAFTRLEAVWAQPWELLKRPPARRRVLRWPVALAASIVVMALAVGALLYASLRAQTFATLVGETRVITLADGTSVTLGGASAIAAKLSARERVVVLERGEAFFQVAKDARRPFSVHAGDARVTAVGTAFNVRRGGDRVVVAVVEGRVIVDPAPSLLAFLEPVESSATPLVAGEKVEMRHDQLQPKRQLADAAAATAWQSGQLAFRQEPLREVLEDVNRYSRKPIVLADESIGDIQITGTVLASSVAGWIEGLESGFGLEAEDEGERIVLRRR